MTLTPLQEWINAQIIDDEMIWKGAFGSQMMFIRDTLAFGLMLVGLRGKARVVAGDLIATVISTHRSKSILLPVVELHRQDLGLRFILRNNFYNWKVSVLSQRPIVANFDGLFHTTPPVELDYTGNELSPVYFEGFPEDLIFDYYESNQRERGTRWSAEIGSNHELWTTIYLIMKSLGFVKPLTWHTRESHRKELDEEYGRKVKETT